MAPRPLSAVVLAAGEGTRMRSERPKPLHLLCGRPMVRYVLDALGDCDVDRVVVVVGHGAERVTKKLQADDSDYLLDFVEQHAQLGTGDATSVGLTAFPDVDDADDADVLVLPGDTPLLRPATIRALVDHHRSSDVACTVLTARFADPSGYGRVVRGRDGRVARIVEHRDATPEQREIDEINTSIYCFRRSVLAPALRRLQPVNDQGEYYLTDVVEVLSDAGYGVSAVTAEDTDETHGVNDRSQLAAAEAELRRRTNLEWLRRGVTMVDPDRTYVDTTVDLATDVTLFPGTILQGRTVIGEGSEIGPDTRLVDCIVGARSTVEQATGRDAEVGADAHVGPYAHLAPGTSVPDGTTTGPFHAATDAG
ncbi:NTP transferase domain-containing protein [Iamia majanohamensis]|uniref:NTP transferase domain-containing protein n=1 Tax=Iamia majanohamensis TaxID=467976 RepID=A0AAE9Y7Z7_9ACTN|nr:NTP transferase domain-containing protein [Iamia majanohamensis]WCO68415.1 NTP transferase domain-containing protein [Iamia majanohamensis]